MIFPKGVGQENLEHFRVHPLDHIGLVGEIVKEYLGFGFEFDDLMLYGCVGLLEGCKRYDASLGYKFSTYGSYWIRQAINHAFLNDLRIIRVSAHMYTLKHKLDRGEVELTEGRERLMERARKVWEGGFLGITQGETESEYACSEETIPDG